MAKRRAKDRARRAAQTEEQRQDCLQRRRSRLVRAAESTEKREDRLRQMRIDQHERRAVESTVEREDRLRHMRIDQRERRADESTEEREDRLRQMRIDQYARRAVETIDHRDARLLQVSANQGELYATRRDLPYKQHSIQLKIRRFHDYFATYNYSKCSTCLESFPGLQLCSSTEECMRCSRDTYIPKVYSSTNNMNPGLLPLQLQVNTCILSVHVSLFFYQIIFSLFRLHSIKLILLFVRTEFDTGGRDVDFCGFAYHVPLQTTSRTVCVQWSYHQSATGCSFIC